MKLIDFINSNIKTNENSEILFFGGSFNPWHEGHTSCLKLAPKKCQIIVIPDHNPFKEITLMDHKYSDLKEITAKIQELNKENIHLFDTYLKEDKKNPSHVWIQELKENAPDLKISLLMGFDTFISLDKWIESDIVINNLSSLYVASRLDNELVKTKQVKLLKTINKNLNVNFIGNHAYENISSTAIRNA